MAKALNDTGLTALVKKIKQALSGKADTSSLATVATSGSYNDLSSKPTIPTVGTLNTDNTTAQTASSSESLSGAVSLHKVSKTGSYNDLLNKPTIPTVNNATLTIQKNGANVATFTANASTSATANITVPTATSDLTNDSGFLGDADVSYDANTKTLVIGAVYEDIWYAKVSNGNEFTYEFLKENDNKWSVDNPYSKELGYCDSIYFTYKGENYYVTEIRDMVPAALSKTGNPVAVNLGRLNRAYITKDANDNFSVYFEAD